MRQHNHQLNSADMTACGRVYIFASPKASNISFSWNYLKHNLT